jgi:hypothetical protein
LFLVGKIRMKFALMNSYTAKMIQRREETLFWTGQTDTSQKR